MPTIIEAKITSNSEQFYLKSYIKYLEICVLNWEITNKIDGLVCKISWEIAKHNIF